MEKPLLGTYEVSEDMFYNPHRLIIKNVMEMNATIETKTITDIRGKEKKYVIIKTGKGEEPITVGKKTFDKIKKLIK